MEKAYTSVAGKSNAEELLLKMEQSYFHKESLEIENLDMMM